MDLGIATVQEYVSAQLDSADLDYETSTVEKSL
jgi:hypothetical protein